MLHNFVLFKNLIEDVQRPSTVDHEIFGEDLKPVDNGFARKNMLVMWSAEPNSNPVICKPIKAISRHLFPLLWRRKEGQENSPNPPHRTAPDLKLLLRRLGAIGGATALALAGVLAFAAIVASFATTLALARVLAFTSVLFLDLLLVLALVLILRAERSLQRRKQGRSLNCCSGSGEQSRERRTGEQSLCRLRHIKSLLSIRMRCEPPSGHSFLLEDRESRCLVRPNWPFAAISRRP